MAENGEGHPGTEAPSKKRGGASGLRKGGRVQDHDPRSSCFGYPTYHWYVWRFVDSGEPIWPGKFERSCASCGLKLTPEGYDPCLGELAGVKYACCGHGAEAGYVMFEDGTVIRGRFTAERRRRHGAVS